MSPSEFFRPRALPVLGPGIAILLLAACQTTPAPEMAPAPEPVAEPAPQPSIARPAAPVTPVPAPQPVPATSLAADLIGQPPSALEALTGAPALTRTELAGEFRRYDLGACRVYAVIAPNDAGRPVIGSLSVSGHTPEQATMTLRECLAAN